MDNTVSTDIIKRLEQARVRSATDFGTFINEEDLVGVCEDRFYEGVAYAASSFFVYIYKKSFF